MSGRALLPVPPIGGDIDIKVRALTLVDILVAAGDAALGYKMSRRRRDGARGRKATRLRVCRIFGWSVGITFPLSHDHNKVPRTISIRSAVYS